MLLMIASNRSTGNAARFSSANFAGRLARAGVKVNRPAAHLAPRHMHVAAVLLQHAGSGPIHVAKHRVADAAGEQRHGRPSPADRPAETPAAALHSAAAAAACRPSAAAATGKQPRQPRRLQQPHQAGPLRDPRRQRAHGAASPGTETARTECSDETNRRRRDGRLRRDSIATRNGSISLPYCTPEGHAVSHARQSRHSSRCRRTRSFSSSLPSVTPRIR